MPMLRLCIPECCLIPIVSVSTIELLYRNVLYYSEIFYIELQSLKREPLQLFIFTHGKVHVLYICYRYKDNM